MEVYQHIEELKECIHNVHDTLDTAEIIDDDIKEAFKLAMSIKHEIDDMHDDKKRIIRMLKKIIGSANNIIGDASNQDIDIIQAFANETIKWIEEL